MEEEMEQRELDDVSKNSKSNNIPLAAFHPNLGMIPIHSPTVSKRPIQLEMEKDPIMKDGYLVFNPESQCIVHGREGPYVMDKSKWLSLTLPDDEPVEGLTQEDVETVEKEDMMDSLSNLSKDSEWGETGQGWQSPKSKKKKKKKGKKVMMATRTSQRIAKDSIPIAMKTTSRATAKSSIPGMMNDSNIFTILNNTPNETLHIVMNDLNIAVEDVEGQIGAFRAEEMARAALAEANYKIFLEKLKDRDKSFSEDLSEDFTMGMIDNSKRDNTDSTVSKTLAKGVTSITLDNDVAGSS